MASPKSTVSGVDSKQCMECRWVGGTCLIGVASYVLYQSKDVKTQRGKIFSRTVAAALGLVGVARLLNLPPFQQAR